MEKAGEQSMDVGRLELTAEKKAVEVEHGGRDRGREVEMKSSAGQHSVSVNDFKHARVVDVQDSRYDAYVRLYEALSGADENVVKWHEPAASSHSPSDTSRSGGRSSSSSSDSSSGGSSNDSPSAGAAADSLVPPSIARLTSRVMPHYVDEVTDLRILGSGQWGHVYCGYYRGTPVVVKLPKSRSMSAAQWREWQAHLRLPSHPNLVRFIGSLVMEDTNYLVLQWVEQGSLKQLLNAQRHSPGTGSTAISPNRCRCYSHCHQSLYH